MNIKKINPLIHVIKIIFGFRYTIHTCAVYQSLMQISIVLSVVSRKVIKIKSGICSCKFEAANLKLPPFLHAPEAELKGLYFN